jgi:hypothetical protein
MIKPPTLHNHGPSINYQRSCGPHKVDASGALGLAEVVIPAIEDALNKDKSEIVRTCAVLALKCFPENSNALRAIEHASVNDSSAKVRDVAARALRVRAMLIPKNGTSAVTEIGRDK